MQNPTHMKKSMLVLFVLSLAIYSFAGQKDNGVTGTWKYKVETDQGQLTGTLKFEEKEGNMTGEVHTQEGEILSFSKVELLENDMVYCELDTGYEILEVSLTLKGNTMEGTVGNEQGSFPITCEKVE